MSIHYTNTLSRRGGGVKRVREVKSEPRLIQNFILNLIFFYIIFKYSLTLLLPLYFENFNKSILLSVTVSKLQDA